MLLLQRVDHPPKMLTLLLIARRRRTRCLPYELWAWLSDEFLEGISTV
jgi:hypothetical protein